MESARSARPILLAICGCLVLVVAIAWALGRGPEPSPPKARASAPVERARTEPTPDVAAPPPSRFAESPASAGLPHTKLPLRLLATVVRENREYSLATIADTETSQHEVMTEGQPFVGRPLVRITSIERGRVLLDHDGVREQLVLAPGTPPPPETAELAPSPEERERRRELSEQLRELRDGERVSGIRARAGVLAQGDFEPVYGEDGELVGVHFQGIEPGGFYDQIGLRDGDVVTAINGVSLADPTAAAQMLEHVTTRDELVIMVRDADGSERAVAIPTEQLISAGAAIPGLE